MNSVASPRAGTSQATYASAAGSLDSALVAASVPPCPKLTTTADLDTAGKLCGASNDASQESGELPIFFVLGTKALFRWVDES